MERWLDFGVAGNFQKRRRLSTAERIVRYRRNAIIGVYFGVAAIIFGVLLEIVRMGVFQDHQYEMILGMFVFVLGYVGVITGCSYWLKAKGWPDAVVFIGLMPLAVFFIPFVRLLVFRVPSLLIMAMVMMPLILVVVVAVLPDKSGMSKRRPWWERK